jgi:hypothetical protein
MKPNDRLILWIYSVVAVAFITALLLLLAK